MEKKVVQRQQRHDVTFHDVYVRVPTIVFVIDVSLHDVCSTYVDVLLV